MKKILKYLFFLLLIVIIGGAVYYGTKDGKFDIARTKTMNTPPSVIYDNVSDFKNWQKWGSWMEMDPNIEISYSDNTVGAGGSYSWKSEIMGDGAMTTMATEENISIDQEITFTSPLGESLSDVYWKFVPNDQGGTEVTWGMKGEHSFMEKVFMGLMAPEPFEESLSTMYDNGLAKLDTEVQNEMKKYTIQTEGIKEYGGGYYMYTTTSSSQGDIGSKMGPMMGKVAAFMTQNNVAMAGMPFTIYNEWDTSNGSVIFSTAIPTKERVIVTEGDVLCSFMEPLTAVKTVLKGNYTNLPEAYQKAQAYIATNNLVMDPSKKMFEVYSNDPSVVTNPAEWTTAVYIPVFKDLRSNHPIISGEQQ